MPDNAPIKIMSPQALLEEFRQIRIEIQSEELTPEGRIAILEQVQEIEALLLLMKKELLERNGLKES